MSTFIAKVRQIIPGIETFERDKEGYDPAVASWNILSQFRPLYVARPETAGQVVDLIKIANEEKVTKINFRSGGHSFEGISFGGENGDGLVIDFVRTARI